jgi:hypothetical protein
MKNVTLALMLLALPCQAQSYFDFLWKPEDKCKASKDAITACRNIYLDGKKRLEEYDSEYDQAKYEYHQTGYKYHKNSMAIILMEKQSLKNQLNEVDNNCKALIAALKECEESEKKV